jgi:hypothetical protein
MTDVPADARLSSTQVHVIDCDADPFVPTEWTVEEHQKGGQFIWNVSQVRLYLSDQQSKRHGRIRGTTLRAELERKHIFNANVLDYLLAHPVLVPDEWKSKVILFMGTIYSDSRNFRFIRCLRWGTEGWGSGYVWLDEIFSAVSLVAFRSA